MIWPIYFYGVKLDTIYKLKRFQGKKRLFKEGTISFSKSVCLWAILDRFGLAVVAE